MDGFREARKFVYAGIGVADRRAPVRPDPGPGYLAGEFPGGITTVDGVPTTATIRVIYRPLSGAPGDGAVVAEVQSAPDGTWRVDGLDPTLTFDVVGRKAGYNDVIMAAVRPEPYDGFEPEPEPFELSGNASLSGEGAEVLVRSARTGIVVARATPDQAGDWATEVPDLEVYLDSVSAPVGRALAAAPADGYLAGKVKLNGDGPALVRVHYRAEAGEPGDGMLVAQVETDAAGAWAVSGLDPTRKFDVVARRANFADVITSGVSPVVDAP